MGRKKYINWRQEERVVNSNIGINFIIYIMPFTISHIAAVLPAWKKTPHIFSFTGLVVGSMAPDFEYFIRMTLYGHYGHTMAGIFIFDLPIGILIYILYHGIVRFQMIRHFPRILYARFSRYMQTDWETYLRDRYARVVVSILIGIVTHLVWDGFTHDREYIVAIYLPALLTNIHLAGLTWPLYAFLQTISSIAGIVILLVFIYKMPPTTDEPALPPKKLFRYWSYVGLTAGILFVLRWSAGVPNEKIPGQIVVISMSAVMLSLVLISLCYNLKKTE